MLAGIQLLPAVITDAQGFFLAAGTIEEWSWHPAQFFFITLLPSLLLFLFAAVFGFVSLYAAAFTVSGDRDGLAAKSLHLTGHTLGKLCKMLLLMALCLIPFYAVASAFPNNAIPALLTGTLNESIGYLWIIAQTVLFFRVTQADPAADSEDAEEALM